MADISTSISKPFHQNLGSVHNYIPPIRLQNSFVKPKKSSSFYTTTNLYKNVKVMCNSLDELGNVASECSNAEKDEQFLRSFRESCHYSLAHRGSTFVVLISAEIVDSPHLDNILMDISFMHGLGIKFIIVPGTHVLIDRLLVERGSEPKYVGRYRITDPGSLEAVMDAAGRISIILEAKLSPGPSLSGTRRHGGKRRLYDGVSVASGNFLAAKRRGVVEGIDFVSTGEVKKIDVCRIRERLDQDCIVLLSNLGFSSSGEVLNCNTYEVATACALSVGAEKLICIIDGPLLDEGGRLIRFLTLNNAETLIRERTKQSETAATYVKTVDEEDTSCSGYNGSHGAINSQNGSTFGFGHAPSFQNGVGFDNGNGLWSSEQGFAIGGQERQSRLNGYLSELAAAAFACRGRVQRVHLLDGTIGGVLVKELYQRDGVGTMVASDLYEGTRKARMEDVAGIKQLLRPLEESGTLVKRTAEQGQIIACGALFPYYKEKCGELAAIAVSPDCRGQGQGEKLLYYIEREASCLGLERFFLLTTRTADWFVRRGFSERPIEVIPEERRKKINLSRNSKYYTKRLLPDRSGYVRD